MRKIPRGVYYLSFGRILQTLVTYPFKNFSSQNKVEEFEKEAALKLNSPYALAMPHARISLYYLLKYYRLDAGSEVLMSPTTLPDMVNMVLLLGLKPVFVDFKENTHTADISKAEKLLTSKSKVLYLTHLYGILPDMNEILAFTQKNNLIFIQDCTQSYGTSFEGKPVTEFANATFYSTCSLKDLHTHMGSLLCVKSADQMRAIRKNTVRDFHPLSKKYFWKFLKEDIVASLALNPYLFSFFTYYIFKILFAIDAKLIEDLIDGRGLKLGPWIFFKGLFGGSGDERRTKIPHDMLYHFNDLQAEVGLQGLKDMDDFERRRRQNTLLLIEHLSDKAKARLPHLEEKANHSFWRIPIYVDDQKHFEHFLFDHGIDPGKTTLPCLPDMDIFKDLKQSAPVALKMGNHSYFLPNFHYLNEREIKHVASTINQYFAL
nr:DegT/DnrJ/EryC1/StrS family aminotransferase [Bacteriovorax sp. HI3]